MKYQNLFQRYQQRMFALRSAFIAGSLLIAAFIGIQHANAASVTLIPAYGLDTVAGYSAFLTTAQTQPQSSVTFIIEKPNGAKVQVSAVTDDNGVATAELVGEQTKQAGRYAISALLEQPSSGLSQGAVTYFTVYTGEVDTTQSVLTTQRNIARANGTDVVYLSLTLKDSYGNPYSDHVVQLVSTRQNDQIVASNKTSTTDTNGTLTFKVTSNKPGVSVYSAVDPIAEKSLTQSVKVAYSNTYMENAGGDFNQMMMADTFAIPKASAQASDQSVQVAQADNGVVDTKSVAVAQDAGPIHHFDVGGLPAVVQPNQNVNVTITAQDQNNLTVQNYTGTLHFAVEGDNSANVTLPDDYTFKASDLGTHQFNLGLQFKNTGSYNLVVTDSNNQLLKGEKTVSVGSGGSNQNNGGGASKPVITSPVSGTYSQNQQMVSGTATPGSTLKIYDNEQEIGTVQTSSDGSFAYQTTALSDGKHTLYVVALGADQTVKGTSDNLEITIDTTSPTVDGLEVTPSTGITASTVLNVSVMSEKDLSQASLIFNGEIVNLSPSLDKPGTYVASLKAPANPGEYQIDVLLVDALGNEVTSKKAGNISVGSSGGTATGTTPTVVTPPPTDNTTVQNNQNNKPPSQVFGVTAYGSDKRVTLVWQAATDDSKVKNYRVYYGMDPANLTEKVDTKDAATTWYVPNLQNGKEYYFAITALDDQGVESLTRSELVSGIAFILDVQKNAPQRSNEPIQKAPQVPPLKGAAPEDLPKQTSKNGPELIFFAAGSGIVGLWAKRKKK